MNFVQDTPNLPSCHIYKKLKMKKFLAAFLLIGLIPDFYGQNFVAIYTFDSVSTSSGTVDPTLLINPAGISLGRFSAAGVSANSSGAGRFSFTGWPAGAQNGATSYASLTGVPDTGKFYSVSLAPLPDVSMSLNTLNFTVQRSGTGIRTYIVRSSQDGYTLNLPASINSGDTNLSIAPGQVFFFNKDNITTARYGSTVTLGGNTFSNLIHPVTFRFYGYNAEGGIGTFSIDNVIFSGLSGLVLDNHDRKSKPFAICSDCSGKGLFEINCESVPLNLTLTVYNVLGEPILSQPMDGNKRYSIDLREQPEGMYIILISRGEELVLRKKIIKS